MTKRTKTEPTIGGAIDALHAKRDLLADLNKKVEALKSELANDEAEIIRLLGSSNLESGRGRLAQASIKRDDVPQIEDFDKVCAYIVKKKAWDLIQRRLASRAVKARWDEGVAVPGVGKFTRVTLHVTKV